MRGGASPHFEEAHQTLGIPSSLLKGLHESLGVKNPNLRGNTEDRQSITPIGGNKPKRWSPSRQFKGHAKMWEFRTPTQGATPKHCNL